LTCFDPAAAHLFPIDMVSLTGNAHGIVASKFALILFLHTFADQSI
jgi:hypothetical protein